MKQGIADLLKSENIEDIELGLILARRENIPCREVLRTVLYWNSIGRKYIRSSHMGKKYKWRKNV